MDLIQSVFAAFLALCGVLGCAWGQEFVSEAQGLTFVKGSNVTLYCKVSSLGAMNVIWLHETAVLSMNHMTVGGDKQRLGIKGKYNLHISNVTLADEGRYVCQVTSTPPIQQSSFINVTVPAKAEVLNKKADIESTLKANITLKCGATGRPEPNISWSREDKKLPDGSEYHAGDTITLTNLAYDHGGVYRCTAYNGVGEPGVDTVRINVFYKPRIHSKPKTVHTGPGFQTKIPCIVSAQPRAGIEWRHNGTRMNLRSLPQHHSLLNEVKGFKVDNSLVIRGLKDADLGTYACKATNKKGSAAHKVLVTALPSRAKITSGKQGHYSTVYSLSWEVTSAVLPEVYQLRIREMNDTDTGNWTEIDIDADAAEGEMMHAHTYSLSDLTPDSDYEVELRTYNSYGWGDVNDRFIFTTNAHDPDSHGNSLVAWQPATCLLLLFTFLMTSLTH